MEVSGQLQGKSPRYPLDRRLGAPQSRSGRGSEEEKFLPLLEIEPRSYLLIYLFILWIHMYPFWQVLRYLPQWYQQNLGQIYHTEFNRNRSNTLGGHLQTDGRTDGHGETKIISGIFFLKRTKYQRGFSIHWHEIHISWFKVDCICMR